MKLFVSSGFTLLSNNNNKKIPTQSSQPFLPFIGISLVAGILWCLYIHTVNIVVINCELELKDYTCISYSLWTITFPEWRSYIDLPIYPPNYSNCIAKHCSSTKTLVQDVWDFNFNLLHFYQQNHTCGQRKMLCVGFCSAQNIHSLAKKADYKKVSKRDPCCHLRSDFSQQPQCSGWAVKSIHSPVAGSAKCFSETTCCSAMWSQLSSKEDSAAPQKASRKPVSWFRINPPQQGLARPVCSIPVTGPWSSGKGLGTATFHHPPCSSGVLHLSADSWKARPSLNFIPGCGRELLPFPGEVVETCYHMIKHVRDVSSPADKCGAPLLMNVILLHTWLSLTRSPETVPSK